MFIEYIIIFINNSKLVERKVDVFHLNYPICLLSQSQWPRSLRRRSTAARLL